MTDPQKSVLHDYLRATRDDLMWKLDGMSERDARLPRTSTGNNLLGVIKHCLNVEAGYFGPTFGREFPTPHELVPLDAYDEDPQADWYARPDETKDGLLELYRRVAAFADETIEQLPLEAVGRVPWWRPASQEVTLQRIMVHVLCDLARHAGHADLMREAHDGAVGWQRDNSNVPADYDWPAYVAKLTALADRSGPSRHLSEEATAVGPYPRAMTTLGPEDRTQPPVAGDEAATLLGFLNYQRDTLRWKCSGLSAAQLTVSTASSTLTLGGLLKHLSVVEAGWLNHFFAGGVAKPSWLDERDREDPDWSLTSAASASPEQLFAWLDESIAVSDRVLADALAGADGLSSLSAEEEDGQRISLRWILCHLIEEYARHNGHADLLRESLDGSTGE